MDDKRDDLNTWTYFEFEHFGGQNYGYIRKRDHVQALFFSESGVLMVNLNAEASCTPAEQAELERIAFMVFGGEDYTNRVINPFRLVPRRLANRQN